MRTGAVIAAAGMSSRMGDFKPLMSMGAMSIIGRVIVNFQQAEVFPIVVVTGFHAELLEKHIAKMGVICVRNPNYEHTEMFDSALLGFSFIRNLCDRVFFTPADIPLFTYDTVRQLLDTVSDVTKPVYFNREGHPVLLSGALVDKIIKYKGNGGLKTAIDLYAEDIKLIAVEDEGILLDADTKEEYKDLLERNNKLLFRPAVDVSLMREGRIFDKNAALLLHMVAYSGTVKVASEKIGISYSKAWKMLAALEERLGFPLLKRQHGGEAGGMSILTEDGRKLLFCYEQYAKAVKKYAEDTFDDYFDWEP